MDWLGADGGHVADSLITGPIKGLGVAVHQTGPIPLAAEFICQPGELLALVGPSGSGKTTLLRTIAGLYRPQNGRVECAGDVWFDAGRKHSLPPQRRQVGMVFQDYALFPHLTALENIQLPLGHLPQSQRLAQAEQWLAKVRLDGLGKRYPNALSGGNANGWRWPVPWPVTRRCCYSMSRFQRWIK